MVNGRAVSRTLSTIVWLIASVLTPSWRCSTVVVLVQWDGPASSPVLKQSIEEINNWGDVWQLNKDYITSPQYPLTLWQSRRGVKTLFIFLYRSYVVVVGIIKLFFYREILFLWMEKSINYQIVSFHHTRIEIWIYGYLVSLDIFTKPQHYRL